MTNYTSPTVIKQEIPGKDMLPVHLLLLSLVFDYDVLLNGEVWEDLDDLTDEDKANLVYFFNHESPDYSYLHYTPAEIKKALDASPGVGEKVKAFAERLISDAEKHGIHIEERHEFSAAFEENTWDVLQDIVRRSTDLTYIAIETAFYCGAMRKDGFGGSAVFISADKTEAISTTTFLEKMAASLDHQEDDAGANVPAAT